MSVPRSLDVVLIEPWYGGSHRAWADGVVRHSRHRVHLLTLDDRFWRWRLRGGALTIAAALEEHVDRHGVPDVVLVSGMVDLAALRGLARRGLGDAPVALYLHENQVVHPEGPARRPGDPLGWVTWMSMAAADQVLLNSEHHREVLLRALPGLLAGAPDHPHTVHLDAVAARCEVVPVGVELAGIVDGPRGAPGRVPLVLWNQRWDEDRQPARLLRILCHLADDGVPFELALAGRNTRSDPREFTDAIAHLGDRVVHVGWCEPAAYRDLLLRSDVVVSVARHEYFGISVVEAVAAGAVPVLPDALSYPELLPESVHDLCLYRSAPAERLRRVLCHLDEVRADARIAGLRDDMRRWGWDRVGPQLDEALARVAGAAT